MRRLLPLSEPLLVLTPPVGDMPTRLGQVEQPSTIDVVLVTDQEGHVVLPAFTSEATLLRWRPEGSHYAQVGGNVLLSLLAHSDWSRIVVDPGSSEAFEVSRGEAIATLAEGDIG